jgi:hypothetical protein
MMRTYCAAAFAIYAYASMGKAFRMSARTGNAPNAMALFGPSPTDRETKPRLRR